MKLFWFLKSSTAAPAANARPLQHQLAAPRLVLWASLASVAIFLLWAQWAELDQITRAPGVIVASSRTQIIQSQEGGTLEELRVKEGDVVERGQVLATLERTRAESAYLETRAKAAGLGASVARLQAEVYGGKPRFGREVDAYPQFRDNQLALFHKRQDAIQQEVTALEGMLRLARQELEMNRPLLTSGDVSRTEVLRLERQAADLQAQITNRRNKYFQDAQAELAKAEEDLAGVSQILAQRKSQLEQTELRAPMNGVVKNVRITTRGGVVRPGEEVMQIVPGEDDLVIEAKVAPADIAFVRAGQPSSVKIDAYDYTIYGNLPAKVSYVSADTLNEDLKQGEQPYYRVRLKASGRRFSARPETELEIQPGMTATVEIKTGSSTVLHYLTKPVVKTLSESMVER